MSYPPVLIVTLITIAGGILRFWGLGAHSLWLDEGYSYAAATLDWTDLWLSDVDVHPPLYYSVLKGVLALGDSEYMLRLPSAVFGTALIPLIYGLGKQLCDRTVGLLAALYLAVNVVHIEYSQEARAYAMLVFLIGLALYAAISYAAKSANTETDRMKRLTVLILYAAAATAALYSQVVAAYPLLVINLFVLAVLLKAPAARSHLAAWLAINLAVLILWLPWLRVIFVELMPQLRFGWLEHASVLEALNIWLEIVALPYAWAVYVPVGVFLIECLVIFALWVGRTRVPGGRGLLVGLLIGAPFLVWLTGYLQPVYMLRTVLWALIAAALVVGLGLSRLPKWLGAVATIALLFGGLWTTVMFHQRGLSENEDWRAAVALAGGETGAAALIICSDYGIPVYRFYARASSMPAFAWNRETETLIRPYGPTEPFSIGELGTPADWSLEAGESALLIRSHCPDEQFARLLDRVGGTASLLQSYKKVAVYRLAAN